MNGHALRTLLFVAALMAIAYVSLRHQGGDDAPSSITPEIFDISSDTVADPAEVITTPEVMPPLAEFASECFRQMRARNPRGRVLKLNANRLADRCSIIVEVDADNQRWMFDWRDHASGYVHEGELRLPDGWSDLGAGIVAADYANAQIEALVAQAHAEVGDAAHDEWLYEIVWLPAPFARSITFITLSDTGPEAEPYGAYASAYDGDTRLDTDTQTQAEALYPMTRFELREDHSFKGPMFESTALAEAAISLETDPDAGPPSALLSNAEVCMDALHKVNTGARVLRVAIAVDHCHLVMESAAQQHDFYLLGVLANGGFDEQPSVMLDTASLPNLLLDRSRLTMPRVRERLAQAEALRPAAINRIAVAWVAGAMIWQFSGDQGSAPVWLDENGASIAPPAHFPISASERALGFPPSEPTLQFAAEVAD